MNREDSLDFIADIRIAQFWRQELGDIDYTSYNPADLRRWYEGMELRGPEEIRAYVNERTGRHPDRVITGIVTKAPHPPVKIVNVWLQSHDAVRTGPAFVAMTAFVILSFFGMSRLNGCANIQTANIDAHIRQSATLTAGQLTGSPTVLSTLPRSSPGSPNNYPQVGVSVQGFQPRAAGMTAQQGTAFQTTPGLAQIGSSSSGGASASASALNGGGSGFSSSLGGQSPGPSAFQPGTVASAGMHTANTGSSSNVTGLGNASGH